MGEPILLDDNASKKEIIHVLNETILRQKQIADNQKIIDRNQADIMRIFHIHGKRIKQ